MPLSILAFEGIVILYHEAGNTMYFTWDLEMG